MDRDILLFEKMNEIYDNKISFMIESLDTQMKINMLEAQYKVITEYYGLDNQLERSIKEIAKEMNLGDERIRQIRKGAIKKLEKRCGKTLKTLL